MHYNGQSPLMHLAGLYTWTRHRVALTGKASSETPYGCSGCSTCGRHLVLSQFSRGGTAGSAGLSALSGFHGTASRQNPGKREHREAAITLPWEFMERLPQDKGTLHASLRRWLPGLGAHRQRQCCKPRFMAFVRSLLPSLRQPNWGFNCLAWTPRPTCWDSRGTVCVGCNTDEAWDNGVVTAQGPEDLWTHRSCWKLAWQTPCPPLRMFRQDCGVYQSPESKKASEDDYAVLSAECSHSRLASCKLRAQRHPDRITRTMNPPCTNPDLDSTHGATCVQGSLQRTPDSQTYRRR